MTINTPLRRLTFIALTTVLFVSLYLCVSFVEDTAASSQSDVPTITEQLHGPNESTSNGDAVKAALAVPSFATTPVLPACPSPTERVGRECVLTKDVILSKTLVLPSGTHLDCRRHKISRPLETTVLTPQVGIFLKNVKNVVIERCQIEGFDFGVFAVNSKRPPGDTTFKSFTMMGRNIIRSVFTALTLLAVDNAEITDNDIIYTRFGGAALYLARNSDSNKITKNHFIADLKASVPSAPVFRAPGRESPANPRVNSRGAAVVIAETETGEPTVLNVIVDGDLSQLSTATSEQATNAFSEDNRFEGNKISFNEVAVDGIAMPVSQGTRVVKNVIDPGAEVAIRVGSQNGVDKVFPGRCKRDQSRLCFNDAGCRIADTSTPDEAVNKGPCSSTGARPVFWIANNTRIVENDITGPMGSGIATTGQRTLIIGNKIVGPIRDAAKGAGIRLVGKHALESTIVAQNSVSNVAVALNLVQIFQCMVPSKFAAEISRNDFTNYDIGVLISRTPLFPKTATTEEVPPDPNYSLPTELSVAGRGNFWGKTLCLGLSGGVERPDTKPDLFVSDKHPYNTPVANVPLFPSPCPGVLRSFVIGTARR